MKRKFEVPLGKLAGAAGNRDTQSKHALILRSFFLLIFLLAFVFGVQGPNPARDPGLRAGSPGAGNFVAGLTSSQRAYFMDGQTRFQEVESVQNGANNGLGPTF